MYVSITGSKFSGDHQKMMEWAKEQAKKETELYHQRTGKISIDFS